MYFVIKKQTHCYNNNWIDMSYSDIVLMRWIRNWVVIWLNLAEGSKVISYCSRSHCTSSPETNIKYQRWLHRVMKDSAVFIERTLPSLSRVCPSRAPLFISLHLQGGLKPYMITSPFRKHHQAPSGPRSPNPSLPLHYSHSNRLCFWRG